MLWPLMCYSINYETDYEIGNETSIDHNLFHSSFVAIVSWWSSIKQKFIAIKGRDDHAKNKKQYLGECIWLICPSYPFILFLQWVVIGQGPLLDIEHK